MIFSILIPGSFSTPPSSCTNASWFWSGRRRQSSWACASAGITLILLLPSSPVIEQVLRVSAANAGAWSWSARTLSGSLTVVAMSENRLVQHARHLLQERVLVLVGKEAAIELGVRFRRNHTPSS